MGQAGTTMLKLVSALLLGGLMYLTLILADVLHRFQWNEIDWDGDGSVTFGEVLQGAVLAFLAVLALLALEGCSSPCESELMETIASPDKSNNLIVTRRNCGATAPYGLLVGISKESSQSIGENNAILFIEWDEKVPLRWRSNNEVELELPAGARISNQTQSYQGRNVKYKQIEERQDEKR